MSVTIIAHSGKSVRGEFEIEKPVVRVGSDARCAVQIPELEPHAITVEQRDGQIFVHNKTARELRLRHEVIAPGQSREWNPDEPLQVRADLALTLRQNRRARRGSLASTASAVRVESATTDHETFVVLEHRKDTRQIGIVVFSLICATVGVVLMLRQVNPAPAPVDPDIEVLHALEDVGPTHRAAAVELQIALQEEWLEHEETARLHFIRSRELLGVARSNDTAAVNSDAHSAALELIAERLD